MKRGQKNDRRMIQVKQVWKLYIIFWSTLFFGVETDEEERKSNLTDDSCCTKSGLIAEISLKKLHECGKYCKNVLGCKSLKFDGKTCFLSNYSVTKSSSSNGTFIANVEQYAIERCKEINEKIMSFEKFTIQAWNRSLYFSEKGTENSHWKKRKATFWVYNTSSQHLQVHNSSLCLSWYDAGRYKANVNFNHCEDDDNNWNQKFDLISLKPCHWQLVTCFGNHLVIPTDLKLYASGVGLSVLRRPSPVDPGPAINISEEYLLRNLSSFQVDLEILEVTCKRYNFKNGILIPKQQSAPIFFEGQTMTFMCQDEFMLKRRGEKTTNLIITCNHDSKEIKLKCVNLNNERLLRSILFGIIATIIVSIVTVKIKRKFMKSQRQAHPVEPGVEEFDETIQSSNKDNTVKLPQFAETIQSSNKDNTGKLPQTVQMDIYSATKIES